MPDVQQVIIHGKDCPKWLKEPPPVDLRALALVAEEREDGTDWRCPVCGEIAAWMTYGEPVDWDV